MAWFSLNLTTIIPIGSNFKFKNGRVGVSPLIECTHMCWNVGVLLRWSDAPAPIVQGIPRVVVVR
jgi:hypothetical protein